MFNAKAFLEACNNDVTIAKAAFYAAFGIPVDQSVHGSQLLILISHNELQAAFDNGEWIIVVDHCVNKYDYSYDLIIKINNKGQAIVSEGGSCGSNDHTCSALEALREYKAHYNVESLACRLWVDSAICNQDL